MSKALVTYRVHFAVQDEKCHPEEVSRVLGLRPTSSGVATPKGKPPLGFWTYYRSKRRLSDLDRAVQQLCERLRPRRTAIRRLSKRLTCWIEIGCFYDCEKIAAPCLPLSAESVRALAAFGVPVYSFAYPCRSTDA